MKILQVNCIYGKGSTGKITKDIHNGLLNSGVSSYVCYGRGEKVEEENVFLVSYEIFSKLRKLRAMFNGKPYKFSPITNIGIERKVDQINPDIVHIQCINGYFIDIYRFIDFLAKKDIPVVITIHGEFMYTGGCGIALDCDQWEDGCIKCNNLWHGLGVVKRDCVADNYNNMLSSIAKLSKMVVVGPSKWIVERAGRSQIMKNCKRLVINNGIDSTNIFHPRKYEKIAKEYNIPDNYIKVLTVVNDLSSVIKGGKTLIEIAKKCSDLMIKFIIIGADTIPDDTPENVIIKKYTQNQEELAMFYSYADVFVICSKSDNYPTVCLEANCCGTPIVGYDVGGVSETIFPGMGEVVPYGDENSLIQKIQYWARQKAIISEATIQNAIIRNSKERMLKEYIQLYNDMIKSQ